MTEKRVISTSDAVPAIGPYSQAISANGFIFVSGQIPFSSDGVLVGNEIQTQTETSLKNIKAILTAAGSSMEKIVKCTVFLKDMNHFPEMNEVYSTFFKENPPARAAVEVARLPKDVLVEIEAISLQ